MWSGAHLRNKILIAGGFQVEAGCPSVRDFEEVISYQKDDQDHFFIKDKKFVYRLECPLSQTQLQTGMAM